MSLLVRAFDLERAALLVEHDPEGSLHPLATHGPVRLAGQTASQAMADDDWSLALPIERGLLLLARAGTAPLSAGEAQLAARIAEAAGYLVTQARLATDLAHARALLARADRVSALGTLAAGIAHEIRNPLVSVRTFVQLLPERLDDEEFLHGFRELALGEIDRISTLVNDLLAFSRPAPIDREPLDMNELVSQVVRLLAPEGRRHGVLVAMRENVDLPAVVADAGHVKQVLMNVVLNAIQACGVSGAVTVATDVHAAREAHWCRISVEDSGAGIAREHAAHIYEPFFTTKETGSGLGLFIAHQLVTEHGGQIEARPREGGGTIFAIDFPLYDGQAGERSARAC